MNRNEKEHADRIETFFESNYNYLNEIKVKLLKANTNAAYELAEQISLSQDILFKTCEEVNALIATMEQRQLREPIRFNAFDSDFEEQVKRAEKSLLAEYRGTYRQDVNLAFNNSFISGRITSFNVSDYEGGMEELMARLAEHINKTDDDNDGGTFYATQ